MKMVALNTYENRGIVALNTYEMAGLNAYENVGSERLWKWRLWTAMKMMAWNTYENDGS